MALIDIDLGLINLRRFFTKNWVGMLMGAGAGILLIKLYQLNNTTAMSVLDPASRAFELTVHQTNIILLAALAIPITMFLGAWIYAIVRNLAGRK